ncbi:MAG: hypothetical protein IJ677_08285 [Alphaproteobacteria bacterium]|nr:hypothetical protein [Alphaproteobacteria bacterium]
MNRDFTHSEIEQVYDDFHSRTADFDVALEDGINDLTQVISQVKNKRDGFVVSDELSTLFEDCRDKIVSGFNEASSANRKQWAPQIASIFISAMDMNFRNADNIIKTTDTIVNAYDNNSRPDSEVYKAFYKVYTHAVRKVRNPQVVQHSSEMANDIFNKIEILKGTGTPDKYLASLVDKPQKNTVLAFEKSLKNELESNPENTAHNVFTTIKTISQIKDDETRDQVYGILFANLKNMLEKSALDSQDSPKTLKMIESGMFKIFELEKATGLWDKAEKNRTPFEMDMKAKKRKYDLDKRIHTILNIGDKDLGVERRIDKPFYPSKKEMQKVVNLLSQYPKIEYSLALKVMGKMDDKQFSNIDDKIIDTISAVTKRMEYGEDVEKNLTGIRAQMHSKGIQNKKEQNSKDVNTDKSVQEKRHPTTQVVFDVKDLPNGTEIGK